MRLDEYYALQMKGAYLCHHGIKGQAWGVTNGPPYPLGSEGKKQARENRRILAEHKTLREKMAARHGKKQTINRQILRANEATNKQKAKTEQTKNEIRKARHAYKDAARRERMKLKAEKQKLRAEEKARQLKIKEEKTKQRAEELKRREALRAERAKANEATRALREQTRKIQLENRETKAQQAHERNERILNTLNKDINVRTPRDILAQRVVNSGNKKMLKKYGNILNNEEYEAATERIKLKNSMDESIKAAKRARFAGFVKKGSDFVSTAKTTIDNGVNAYNALQGAAKVFAKPGGTGFIDKFAAKGPIKIPGTTPSTPKSAIDRVKEMMAQKDIDRMLNNQEPLYKWVKGS